ncbi:MAG: hypothetical protein AAB662_02435 [Patescibacteria group bacterium]
MSGGIETRTDAGKPSSGETKVEWLMSKGPLTPEAIAQRTEALNTLFNVHQHRAEALRRG